MKPFRWNLKRKEQLGQLLSGDLPEEYSEYRNHLVECCAKIFARSYNRRLVFVGRSPENIFDYLSGTTKDTSWEDKIDLLNISNRFRDIENIRGQLPEAYKSLQNHFRELKISPKEIISQKNGICFCDLVSTGSTFEKLLKFIKNWAEEEKEDVHALLEKLGFLGVTWKTKTSPNTQRWQQKAIWTKEFSGIYIKNISAPIRFCGYLGNEQDKVSMTNFPERWNSEKILLPPRDERNIKSLRQAFNIYESALLGKKKFATKLLKLQEIKEPWLRDFVHEIKL